MMGNLLARFGGFLRRHAAMPSVLLFFAGMFVVSQLSMAVVLEPVGTQRVLELQTTLSPATFAALVEDLFRRGVVEHYIAHYYYDFLHPLWYASLVALLLAGAMNRAGVPASRDGWLAVPFLAGLLDELENALHLYMVIDTANITPWAVWLGNGAALAKWTLLATCLLATAALYLRPRPRSS